MAYLSRGVHFVISVGLVPFLIAHLGKEGYGVLAMVSSVAALSVLADLGMQTAISRQVAGRIARGQMKGVNEVVSSGVLIYLLGAAVLMPLALLLRDWLCVVLQVPVELREAASWSMVVGVGCLVMSLFSTVLAGMLAAKDRFDLVYASCACREILCAALVVGAFLSWGGSALRWALITLFSQAMEVVGLVAMVKAQFPGFRLRLLPVPVRELRDLFKLGMQVFLAQLSDFVATLSQPWVIGTFLGTTQLTYYAPARSLIAAVNHAVSAILKQFVPLASRSHAVGDQRAVQAVLLTGTTFVALVGGGLLVTLAMFSRPLIAAWLGTGYETAALLLCMWAFVRLAFFLTGNVRSILIACGRVDVDAKVNVAKAAIDFVSMVYLVGFTHLGLLGVLLPALVTTPIARLLLFVVTSRIVGLGATEVFVRSLLRPMLALALYGVAAWGMALLLPSECGRLRLFAMLSVAAPIGGLLSVGVGLHPSQRAAMQSLLRRTGSALRSRLSALRCRTRPSAPSPEGAA